jgi:hypothetical protein
MGMADGLSLEKAYEAAGYSPQRPNAWKLYQKHHIVSRIKEIIEDREKVQAEGRAKAVEEAGLTVDTLLAKQEAAYRLAMETEQPAAAVAATREMGVLSGLRIERQMMKAQVQNVESVADLDDFSLVEERVRLTLRMAEELGLDPASATVEQYCSAMLDAFDQVHEETERYERMPPGSVARGIRSVSYERPKPQLTKGESDRLHRRGVNAPRVINGSVNGRR